MDPIVTGALINAGSQVLKGGAPAGPSNAIGGYADGTAYNQSPYDGSNWTVSTGSSKAQASNGIHLSWMLVAAAAIVAVIVLKKGKL